MDRFRQKPTVFYIFYFVVFLASGISVSFLNIYLNDAGMEQSTIGLVNGIIQVVSLITFPLWGRAADRASSKNKILIVGLISAIILLVGFYFSTSVIMLAVMMTLYSLAFNPMTGIYETIAMDHVTKYQWNYSPIRMSGTIGYAVMSVVAGFYLTKHQTLLFPLLIGTMVLATFCAALLPRSELQRDKTLNPQHNNKNSPKSVYGMLKDRKIVRVLILLSVYSMTNAFNVTFYGMYMSSLGGNYAMIGVANMVMALAEIPFHIGPGRRWMKRVGVEKCLLLVMAVGTVRWVVCALCQNVWVLVFTMVFNGFMLVTTIIGVVEFLYENAPDDLKASAQTALRSSFQVAGQLIANVGGGMIVGILNASGLPGIRIVYASMAPICVISGLVVWISLTHDAPQKPHQSTNLH